tara:strand:- start:337 stop:489 length:153 start_codon:yes stop_codon:yes gene_type:complete
MAGTNSTEWLSWECQERFTSIVPYDEIATEAYLVDVSMHNSNDLDILFFF